MILDEGRTRLVTVLDILRLRCRGNLTFRKWVILTVSPHDEWDDLRDGMAPTQPIRVHSVGDADRASALRH